MTKTYNDALEWAAKWIEDTLRAGPETNERVIEFGTNMAMTLRAARVQPVDDARVGEIRRRAEIDGYRKFTLRDGNTSLALVQARADVMELLSLLPQPSSSEQLEVKGIKYDH